MCETGLTEVRNWINSMFKTGFNGMCETGLTACEKLD